METLGKQAKDYLAREDFRKALRDLIGKSNSGEPNPKAEVPQKDDSPAVTIKIENPR